MSQDAFSAAAKRVEAGADPHAEAKGLVDLLTLDEKLDCLDGDTAFWPGSVAMGHGAYYEQTWPAAKVERLGIPGLEFADGPRGCVVGANTVFPVSMARGASFDPQLEERVGEAIGAELRANGATYTGAVCMNLLRHPAWGRAQETYGEDPHHVGRMAVALTTGLQRHVMACMKHFAVNSMENARFQVDVVADERALHEVYLPHFREVVRAGVASVMSSYNALNGEWCGENRTLLTDILRDEWGFDGFVSTDFAFGLRDPVKSVVAGCNVEMPFRQQRAMKLRDALERGELSILDVDARVAETFATFLRFARVYRAEPDPSRIVCPAHRALAREAATRSIVLLRNEGGLLPADPRSLRRVAVLGRLAAVANLGDGGSSNVIQPDVTTPLDGLRAALPDAIVEHSDGDARVAADADLAVVVVGYSKADEGEFIDDQTTAGLTALFPPPDHPLAGFPPDYQAPASAPGGDAAAEERRFHSGGDRDSLRLSEADEALVRAVAAVQPRVVVAIMAGSAVVVPWLREVPAALMLWYPGMEGGHALADVLLGTCEPGGRLPFAVPADESQLVDFDKNARSQVYGLLHGQWWLDHRGTPAHLPFGHGLGYTRFALGEARSLGDRVRVDVENVGDRRGRCVVQVYGSVPDSAYLRPPRRLVGFASQQLEPGETTTLEIDLDLGALLVRENGSFVREDAPIALSIGFDAAHTRPVS